MSRFATALILLAIAAAPASAQDVCLATHDTPVCHHYFEGRRADLPVREVLDSTGADCGELVVNILQRQGVLLAPLGESIRLHEPACKTMTVLPLDLPDVRSETDMLVRFSRGRDGNAEAAIALRVYPDTLLEPLTSLAERHSLVVYDDDNLLTGFLDDNGIDYVPGFGTRFGKPIGLLIRPGNAEHLLEDSGIASAVIFREEIVDLPQVRTVATGRRTRVYVEMRLLENLRESPLAQKSLLKILRLAIDPVSIDRG